MKTPKQNWLALAIVLWTLSVRADINLENGWVSESPPGVQVNAAYLDIINDSEQDLIITEIKSPEFDVVELHETISVDGTMKMQRVESLQISGLSTISLTPGGKHLMLIRPRRNIAAGGYVTVVIRFADEREKSILLPVRRDNRRQHMHH